MYRRSIFSSRFLLGLIVAAGIAVAASSWQKEDPGQWTSEDVYQILNNSPWSKSVNVTVARGSGYGNQSPGNNGTWGEGMPGGGMGRGGWGGGMGGGMGRRGDRYPQAQQGPAVTVQWESAVPVRLAEAKLAGGAADASAIKPLNDYVIAVVGLPRSGFDPGLTNTAGADSDDARFVDHLKVITVLSFGHERLNPTKIELNQGRDGRTIFHFEKSEPITLQDKDAEFRITADRMEIRKKFALKDMEYQGKLEL